jgi:tetratricopeptide (TPR) repeat protein
VWLWWTWLRQSSDPLGPGLRAYARGDWETASKVARERLRGAHDDLAAVQLLARTSVRLGRDSSALPLFHQLGPDFMTAEDFYLLGITLSRSGNSKGCVEVWEQGLKANPDHPEILYALTRVYLEGELFQAATETASRLAKHPEWQDRARAALRQIQLVRGDPAVAADFSRQPSESPTADRTAASASASTSGPLATPKNLARVLLRAGRPAEARTQLQTILDQGPDAEASWLSSRAFLQEGALALALAAVKGAGSYTDENPTLPDPAPFVGTASCAKCHAQKFQAQQSSRHARTFHRATELHDFTPPHPSFPDPGLAEVTHTLRKVEDRLEQETRTPERVFKAVVDYAFGSGDRGKTLVGHEESGRMFELRLSVYHERMQAVWDLTSGQDLHPQVTSRYLGSPLTEDAVRRCLSCHVTNPQTVLGTPGPEGADSAIGCEKCHGPGGNHLLAVAAKFPDLAIARPNLTSGARVVKICAQCHSPRGATVSPDDPSSVRFQGTTLTWSRCYTESNDTLDCVTCHDPHRDVVTSHSHYEARCLSCHGGGSADIKNLPKFRKGAGNLAAVPRRAACPVNPTSGCTSCHMPSIKGVIPHSPFTDHFIRVHREPSQVGGG